MPPSRRLLLIVTASVIILLSLITTTGVRHHQKETHALKQTLEEQERLLHPPPPPPPKGPFYKPVENITSPPIEDNFLAATTAHSPSQLPQIPHWNKPKHVTDNTPLFIGFTRNWRILQQAVVSYITAGWPPEDIYVVDNTGTMNSNRMHRLSIQNPFFLDYDRLTKVLGVNVITTPTLLTFAQLQNFYLYEATEREWPTYFWSHMDVIALPDERQRPFQSLYHRAVEELRRTLHPSFGRWGFRFFGYDRLTLVNAAALTAVGGWDTMIPFYGTDCDMHERLAMADLPISDAFIGFIYDMGDSLPDLSLLYRLDDEESARLCPSDSSPASLVHGLGDCRYEAMIRICDDMQRKKNDHEGGRLYWQVRARGGEGEPFYRDAEGFTIGLDLMTRQGQHLMEEKWGHRGCDLRAQGLQLKDAWRVEHDWDRPVVEGG